MTRYRFGDNNEGWKESRKDNLAEVLKGLVEDMKCERKFVGLREGQKPFVEVDERYRGVTIMNIIHLKTGTST